MLRRGARDCKAAAEDTGKGSSKCWPVPAQPPANVSLKPSSLVLDRLISKCCWWQEGKDVCSAASYFVQRYQDHMGCTRLGDAICRSSLHKGGFGYIYNWLYAEHDTCFVNVLITGTLGSYSTVSVTHPYSKIKLPGGSLLLGRMAAILRLGTFSTRGCWFHIPCSSHNEQH